MKNKLKAGIVNSGFRAYIHNNLLFKAITASLICLALLVMLEAATRLLFHRINLQGTEYSLQKGNVFGDTYGWRPGSSGVCFGRRVYIDSYGFRRMKTPQNYRETWLLLGDSVTFGVGVETGDTFAGLLQARYPSVKVLNTAVLGYSIDHYLDVATKLLDSEPKLHRVILFLCLNDIYPGPNLRPEGSSVLDPLLAFLRRSSKFYILIRNFLFDRSESYFKYDLEKYRETNSELTASLASLQAIYSQTLEKGLKFSVIILPYEYQLRTSVTGRLRPQQMLAGFFRQESITFLDAYNYLQRSGLESRRLFLYGDPMHLSVEGHHVVFELLAESLENGNI